ncbi:MAG: shikimate dehydrogenase [Thermoanaerobacterales bacterium]|nr:shikimate dehydrogenase [Thermoanaerobacterales bacterium]
MPDAATRLCGLLGHPVRHSLSPAMQNAAFQAAGLNVVYLAFDVLPSELPAAVAAVRALGLAGVNVTVPHKEACLPLLDELDPEASAVGAVNVVVVRDARLVGYNTDGDGFIRALREAGAEPRGRAAFILGAGGAARAVAVALALAGAARITITNRTPERAARLAADLTALGAQAGTLSWEALAEEAPEGKTAVAASELIIQTTTLGMHPRADAVPPLPARWFSPRHIACDLVYNPRETRFLAAARARGARVVDGLGMLLHQGAASFELWTGQPAPLEVMRRALEAEITCRQGNCHKT